MAKTLAEERIRLANRLRKLTLSQGWCTKQCTAGGQLTAALLALVGTRNVVVSNGCASAEPSALRSELSTPPTSQ